MRVRSWFCRHDWTFVEWYYLSRYEEFARYPYRTDTMAKVVCRNCGTAKPQRLAKGRKLSQAEVSLVIKARYKR